MESLYVCQFSNGHIKVGRSADPAARIAQHEDRVSCLGVSLLASATFECAQRVEFAEALLILRCAEVATRRHKNEWFDGVGFGDACEWARECITEAAKEAPESMAGIRAIRERIGMTQAQLAEGIGCTQGNVSFYERGQTVPPEVAKRLIAFAHQLGISVSYEDVWGDPLAQSLDSSISNVNPTPASTRGTLIQQGA